MSGDRSRRSEQHYSAGARLGTPPRYAQYDKYKASIGRMKKEDTSEAGSESSLLSRWTKIAGVIALYWYAVSAMCLQARVMYRYRCMSGWSPYPWSSSTSIC